MITATIIATTTTAAVARSTRRLLERSALASVPTTIAARTMPRAYHLRVLKTVRSCQNELVRTNKAAEADIRHRLATVQHTLAVGSTRFLSPTCGFIVSCPGASPGTKDDTFSCPRERLELLRGVRERGPRRPARVHGQLDFVIRRRDRDDPDGVRRRFRHLRLTAVGSPVISSRIHSPR